MAQSKDVQEYLKKRKAELQSELEILDEIESSLKKRRIDTISEDIWQQAFHGVVELFQQASNNAVERGISTQLDLRVIPQMLSRPLQQHLNPPVLATANTSASAPVVNIVPIQVQSPQATTLRLPPLTLRPSTRSTNSLVPNTGTNTLPGGKLLQKP